MHGLISESERNSITTLNVGLLQRLSCIAGPALVSFIFSCSIPGQVKSFWKLHAVIGYTLKVDDDHTH